MICELAQTLSNYIRRQIGDLGLGSVQTPISVLGQPGQSLDQARDLLHSLIWITYRQGFPPLLGYHSDAGWGCMIRSAQMLLANVLAQRTHLGEVELLTWFLDGPEYDLSIHNLIESSGQKPSAGHWYGPLEICRMVASRLDSIDFRPFQFLICDDGLYKEEIIHRCSSNISDSRDHPSTTTSSSSWRSSLLVISVRLGLGRYINPAYSSKLLAAVRLPQSCGFIGGAPRSSLYIVGTCADQLFYLDPHVNQRCVTIDDLHRTTSSFHCSYIRAIPVTDLDPCLALAFYIDSRESFEEFWQQAILISPPMFSMENIRLKYNPPDTSTEVEDDFILL